MTLLPLTTVERVKRRMGLIDPSAGTLGDSNLDTLLGDIIDGVSQAVEAWIGAPFYRESRTEYYSAEPFQRELVLRSVAPGMPAPVIISIKTRSNWSTDFDDVDGLVTDEDYSLILSGYGRIAFAAPFYEGTDVVQVTYISGFAGPFGTGQDISDTTEELIAAFPAIADAVDQQVVWEHSRRKEPGQHALNIQGASATQQEVRLLSNVTDRLRSYQRVTL